MLSILTNLASFIMNNEHIQEYTRKKLQELKETILAECGRSPTEFYDCTHVQRPRPVAWHVKATKSDPRSLDARPDAAALGACRDPIPNRRVHPPTVQPCRAGPKAG